MRRSRRCPPTPASSWRRTAATPAASTPGSRARALPRLFLCNADVVFHAQAVSAASPRDRGPRGRRRGAALPLGRGGPPAAAARVGGGVLGRARRAAVRALPVARRPPLRGVRAEEPRAVGARRRRRPSRGSGPRRAPRGARARRGLRRALPVRVRGDGVGGSRPRRGTAAAVRGGGARAASLRAELFAQPRHRAPPRGVPPALPGAALRTARARAPRAPLTSPRRRRTRPGRSRSRGCPRGPGRGSRCRRTRP